MLAELRISSLGVIDGAQVELSPGLNVLTGETGAGKTMIVTALGLLMGQRADAGLVRSGEDQLHVEGWWVVSGGAARDALLAAGAEVPDGEDFSTARAVYAGGRSRAWLGGRGVSAGVLSAASEQLVAVHGQSDQWALSRPAAQREVLDRFGGLAVSDAKEVVATLVRRWREVRAQLAELTELDRAAVQRADTLRAGLAAIEKVDPQVGEENTLKAQEERLGHADTLAAAADSLHTALSGEHLDGTSEDASVAALVSAARSALVPAVDHDAAMGDFDQRAKEVAYLASDLAADVAAYAAGIESDPAALASVQERRHAISGLLRRYGDTIEEVLSWSREAAAELYLIDTADERLAQARLDLEETETDLRGALGRLTAARRDAAERLGVAATAELKHLAMGKAQLTVEVRPLASDGEEALDLGGDAGRVAVHRHGCDEVEILLQANPGSPGRPIAKAASGGELSRVMLALELVSGGEVPTYVFDEVDAGVGGASAVEIGARLARLAQHAQVIVVTHLPQVASFADRHLVVRKASDGLVTASGVAVVEGEEREAELARMLSGEATETARRHARELVERSTTLQDTPPAPRAARNKR